VNPPPAIWTIGHSNRPIDDFVELLRGASIELVADVRRFPASRAHPQFNAEALAVELNRHGIDYRHFVDMGGRRSQRGAKLVNTAWRVAAFNAFADHMQTAEFQASLNELIELAQARPTALMCAEALPWQCHRRLIADALTARGWSVLDIVGRGQIKPHVLPPFARVSGEQVTYPGETLF
jgi:uncharacterized protein (DUF488 family)